MGITLIIIGAMVGITAITVVMIVFFARMGKRMVSGTDEQRETAELLMRAGAKARATITGARPTGLIVGNHNHQLSVDFWLEPLDGAPPFAANKKVFLYQTQFPRTGDVWPAWYDRQDPTVFAVGAPTQLDPAQIPMYREFGIPHPLDSGHG